MNVEEFAVKAREAGKTREESIAAWGKYSSAQSSQPSVESFKKTFPSYQAPKIGTKIQANVLTPADLKERASRTDVDVANTSGLPDEHYASIANSKFLSEQFYISPDNAVGQEKMIGRALYNNENLSSVQINKLINDDVENGTFSKRAALAQWTQYGVDKETADSLDSLYHSDWGDTVRFYTGAAPYGIAKAFTGLVAGAGDLLHLKTPMVDEFNTRVETVQGEYLNDAVIRGNYADYIGAMGTKTAGDVTGQLMLMGKAIKAANAWTGGKMTLVARGRTWKQVAGSTTARAAFLSGLNFVKTEGTLKQKWDSALLTMAYMSTPILSSLGPTNGQAFLADFVLNSGVSVVSGQYKQAISDAHEMADEIGRPDDWAMIAVGNLLPITGSDIAFSALTRSIKQQNNTPKMKAFIEAERIMNSGAKADVGQMEQALNLKYGAGWQKSMSQADRMKYNAIKTVSAALESGSIEPSLLSPDAPATKARVAIEGGRVYYRNSDGVLKPAVETKTPEGVEITLDGEFNPPVKVELQAQPTKGGTEEAPTQEAPKELLKAQKEAYAKFEAEQSAENERQVAMRNDKRTPIKNDNGEELELFHGTRSGINVSDISTDKMQFGKYGKGLGFTPNKTVAETHSKRGFDDDGKPILLKAAISSDAKILEVDNAKAFEDKIDRKIAFAADFRKNHADLFDANSESFKYFDDQYTLDREAIISRLTKDYDALWVTGVDYKTTYKYPEAGGTIVDTKKTIIPNGEEFVVYNPEILIDRTDAKTIDRPDVPIVPPAKEAPQTPVEAGQPKADPKPVSEKQTPNVDVAEAGKAKADAELKAKKADDKERSELIDDITKNSPSSFDIEYIRSINEIQDSLLVGASEKRLAEMKSIADYLEKNPEAVEKLGKKTLKKMKDSDKTPIQNLTTEELRIIASEVDRLRTLGKTKARIQKKQHEEELNKETDEISAEFKAPKKREQKRIAEEGRTGSQKRRPTLAYIATRPAVFFDMLDGATGGYAGRMHKRFVERVNNDRATELQNADARHSGFEKLVSNIGMKISDLNKTITIGGQKWTTEQILGIYTMSKNRLSYNAILHGNLKNDADGAKTIEDINKIVETDPKLKMLADYILYDFATNSDRVFDSIGKAEGLILNREEFYVPMERADEAPKTSIDDIERQVMERQEIIKQSPKDSFKIDRKTLPEQYQNPINLNLVSLWERHVNLQEHYINNIENVKDMRSMMGNKKFRGAMRESYGEAATKYTDEYVDVVANPMSIYGQRDAEVISRRIRKNVATAYLAGNVKTMIKQSPSLAFYLGETTPTKLMEAINELTTSFEKTPDGTRNTVLDWVAEKDPLVKHSHMQRELAELKLQDKSKYDQFMNQIGEVGFYGIMEIDKMVRSAGWLAVYRYNKEKGFSEEESINKARSATLRTQPTAAASDLPPLYRTSEWLNWGLMFSNQLNQIYNMTTKEVPRRLMTPGMRVQGLSEMAGLATSAMVMWAINNGKPLPENEDELIEVFRDQFVASIPLVGAKASQAGIGRDSGTAVDEVIKRGASIAYKLTSGEEVSQDEYWNLFWRGVAPVAGVPVIAIDRAKDALKEGDLGKLTGIKEKKK